MSSIASDFYPPPAFYFKVSFPESSDSDETSFREVSGMEAEWDTQEVVEGGENRFVHRLPNKLKHSQLTLKRGIAPSDSALIKWCISVLENGLIEKVVPQSLNVYLLDENKTPLRGWFFSNAYPTKWKSGPFDSMKNEVAIEEIQLSYNYFNRVI